MSNEKQIFLNGDHQTDAQGEAERSQIHCDFAEKPDTTIESVWRISDDGFDLISSCRVETGTQK